MTPKKRLLFLSRRVPGPAGGPSLRSWNALKALHGCYEIHLLLLPPPSQPLSKKIQALGQKVFIFSERRPSYYQKIMRRFFFSLLFRPDKIWSAPSFSFLSGAIALFERIHYAIAPYDYDVIHLFKMDVLFLLPLLKKKYPAAAFHLDLDDIESVRWERIKKISRQNGAHLRALGASLREKAYKALEKKMLPAFDRVYVCSEPDKKKIGQVYQHHNVRSLPNIYPCRESAGKAEAKKTRRGSFCFILVSSWGYYPNQDALLYFCREILPLLREQRKIPFVVQIIGQGRLPGDIIQKLRETEEIDYIGPVESLDHYYQHADAALVPLRAGGGTRLKVLEAFAYGVPVISTSIGVEGLEIKDGQHVLIGDTPADFAAQCMRLQEETGLNDRLAQEAASLVKEKYSLERLQEILCKESGK